MREQIIHAILLSIVVFASFGQIFRITPFQNISIVPHEILIVLFCIFIVPLMVSNTKIRKNQQLIQSLIIFVSVLGLSLLFGFWKYSSIVNAVGLSYLIRIALYGWFFISLFVIDRKKLESGMMLFTVLTIIISYAQFILYPNLRNLSYLGWDPHQFRAFGLFFDTTTAGIIYALLFFWQYGKSKKNLVLIISLLGLILLSYSRITYISLVIGLAYYLYSLKKLQLFIILVSVFVASILLLPRPAGESANLARVFTITARAVDVQESLNVWQSSPIIGIGYNRIIHYKTHDYTNFPNHSQSAYSSTFITFLVSSGIVGLIAFLYVLRVLFRNENRIGKAIIICVVIASFFDNVFGVNFVLFTFLVLMRLNLSHTSP